MTIKSKTSKTGDDVNSKHLQDKVQTLIDSIETTYQHLKDANESKPFTPIKNRIKNIKDYDSAIELFQKEFSREMKRITSTDATLFKRRIPEHKMEHYIALLNREPTYHHYPRLIALGLLELYESQPNEKKSKKRNSNNSHGDLLSLQLPDQYVSLNIHSNNNKPIPFPTVISNAMRVTDTKDIPQNITRRNNRR